MNESDGRRAAEIRSQHGVAEGSGDLPKPEGFGRTLLAMTAGVVVFFATLAVGLTGGPFHMALTEREVLFLTVSWAGASPLAALTARAMAPTRRWAAAPLLVVLQLGGAFSFAFNAGVCSTALPASWARAVLIGLVLGLVVSAVPLPVRRSGSGSP